ncbi:hypothetical protein J6590_039316 [Homalodisca vitripennis]|nr:hypothetical protein J6590_039316 [Homalodisca vitripennis]
MQYVLRPVLAGTMPSGGPRHNGAGEIYHPGPTKAKYGPEWGLQCVRRGLEALYPPGRKTDRQTRRRYPADPIVRYDTTQNRGTAADTTQHHNLSNHTYTTLNKLLQRHNLWGPTQRLKGDFPTTTNGRAGGLLARTGSLSGHPYKQQPHSTLLDPSEICSIHDHRSSFTTIP